MLLMDAFTHTSYSNENPSFVSYEKLEFLGDAILEFIISEYLYKERQLPEGVMTRTRARYVCEEALATYARDLKFERDIKLGGSAVNLDYTRYVRPVVSLVSGVKFSGNGTYNSPYIPS